MRTTPLAFAALAGAMFVLSSPAFAHEDGKDAEDHVVARVNGDEIRHSQVMAARSSLRGARRRQPLKQVYPVLVDQLVDERLAVQAARRAKLEEREAIRKRIEEVRDRVLARAYWRQAVDARVTDERLQAAYKTFLETFKAEDEVKARHILVKTEAEAKAVIAELEKGADFAELAKTRSTGPTKDRGGDLGYITRRRMVKAFSKAAFKLKPGRFTKAPVKTRYGWHVIKVEDRRKSPPPSFEKKRRELKAQLARSDFKDVRAELRKDAKIESFEPHDHSAEDGAAKKK